MLTDSDQTWLEQFRMHLKGVVDLAIAELKGRSEQERCAIARLTPIWLNGGWKDVGQYADAIRDKTPSSMIFEVWESRCADRVFDHAAKLSKLDGHILICAAGFADTDLGELYSYAAEANQEAWEALYGGEETAES